MSIRKIICFFSYFFFVSINVDGVKSLPNSTTSSTTTLKTTSTTTTLRPADLLLHNGSNKFKK